MIPLLTGQLGQRVNKTKTYTGAVLMGYNLLTHYFNICLESNWDENITGSMLRGMWGIWDVRHYMTKISIFNFKMQGCCTAVLLWRGPRGNITRGHIICNDLSVVLICLKLHNYNFGSENVATKTWAAIQTRRKNIGETLIESQLTAEFN